MTLSLKPTYTVFYELKRRVNVNESVCVWHARERVCFHSTGTCLFDRHHAYGVSEKGGNWV